MSDTPAFQAEHLTKIYRRSHLGRVKTTLGVSDLNLRVSRGEVFGLLGLNGSGKTTTMKLLLGLLFPTEGSAKVMGHPAGSRAMQSLVGYLPEVPYYYRYLSAREVLRFYGRLSGLPKTELADRIEQSLRRVGLAAQAHRPMREYSKGMLQRATLAQALIHNPPALVFDEPVTGLDPLGLKEIRDLLLELNGEGKTVLFSSHTISEAERLCHRVAILLGGRLVRVVTKAEWAGHPGRLEEIFVDTVTGKVS